MRRAKALVSLLACAAIVSASLPADLALAATGTRARRRMVPLYCRGGARGGIGRYCSRARTSSNAQTISAKHDQLARLEREAQELERQAAAAEDSKSAQAASALAAEIRDFQKEMRKASSINNIYTLVDRRGRMM